jgi:hypothetical protein
VKDCRRQLKKIVDEVFHFFEKIADERIVHKPCSHRRWRDLGYRCVPYKKKYVVAYLSQEKEVIICDFVAAKLLS